MSTLLRRAVAEGSGTAGLVLTVFGGGHFATKVGATPAEAAIIATLAVVGTFVCVLHAIGPLTGGHINPAVTISFVVTRQIAKRDALAYIVCQIGGAIGGALLANALWGSAIFATGASSVSGLGYVAECLAAGGLIGVIHGSVRGGHGGRVPFVVPSFIAAASFAAPFGFANPAVAIAKTVAGSGPSTLALLGLLACEFVAAILAAVALEWLYQPGSKPALEAESPADQSTATSPRADSSLVAATFVVTCTPSDDRAQNLAYDVIRRTIRPSDFVVRHSDGRLIVQVDSSDAAAPAALELRANSHLALAALAEGARPVAVTIEPMTTIHSSSTTSR